MKSNLKILFLLFPFITTFWSCERNDFNKPEIEAEINFQPDSFNVIVSEISYNYALLEWSKASDQDNDSLFYSIYLNDVEIAKNLYNVFSFPLNDLLEEFDYSGYISCTDRKNKPIKIHFSFTTKKHYLMFNKLYQIENKTPHVFSLDKTSDGGYILGCRIYISDWSLLAIKLDSLGNKDWHSLFPLNYDGMNIENVQIRQINDGGYIILSTKRIIKLNSSGALVWQYTQPLNLTIGGIGFNSFVQTSDNGFITTGSCIATNSSSLTQTFISKFNEDGVLQWEKFYGSLKRSEGCYIENAFDNNHIILGMTGNEGENDLFVMKINNEGNVIWYKMYIGPMYDFAEQIKNTNDNGFIIIGCSLNNKDVSDARVLKIDNQGTLLWDKYYRWDYFKTTAYSIEQSNDGGYVFTGGNGYTPQECILVKLNELGNIVWKKGFRPDYDDYMWIGKDVKAMDDGGYTIAGIKSYVWNGSEKELGLWIFKTDPEGNF